MGGVFLAWLVEVGIISVRDLSGPRRLPLPSELLGSMVVFGVLGVVGESDTFRRPVTVVAWGLVLSTVLAAYNEQTGKPKSPVLDVLGAAGGFLGGAPTTPAPASSTGTNQGFANVLGGLGGKLPTSTKPATGDVGNILNQAG